MSLTGNHRPAGWFVHHDRKTPDRVVGIEAGCPEVSFVLQWPQFLFLPESALEGPPEASRKMPSLSCAGCSAGSWAGDSALSSGRAG